MIRELKVEIMKLKERQGAIEKEFAFVKNEALSNELKNQKKVFMAQTFLSQLRELSSDGVENLPVLIEKQSTHTLEEPVDGKVSPLVRETPDTKCIPKQDTAGILKLNSEHFAPLDKLKVDDLASIHAVEDRRVLLHQLENKRMLLHQLKMSYSKLWWKICNIEEGSQRQEQKSG